MLKYFVIFLLINVSSVLLLPVETHQPDSTEATVVVMETKKPLSTEPAPLSTTTVEAVPVTPKQTTTKSTSTTTSAPVEITTSKRRLINYDQRQEGHYNIRADLENFVFLVVPTNSASGLNLLDLLSKSAYKKGHHAKHASHKKHEIKGEGIKKIIEPSSSHHHLHHEKPVHALQEEFVEGRTPYKVDISSIDTSPETHLDVLPAAPSSYHPSSIHSSLVGGGGSSGPTLKSIKFAFDDNTPIGSVIPIKGNMLRKLRSYPLSNSYIPPSPILVTVVDHKRDYNSDRKIKNDNDNNNNSGEDNNNFNSILLTTSDSDDGYLNNSSNNDDSFDSLNIANQNKLSPLDQRQQQFEHGWDLKLLGATEQCGPDGYRDSYGVCQYFKLD